jgi:hypothetical protein
MKIFKDECPIIIKLETSMDKDLFKRILLEFPKNKVLPLELINFHSTLSREFNLLGEENDKVCNSCKR